jgi:mannose-6-phosphate isomerase-like protein (cupin superfamily)
MVRAGDGAIELGDSLVGSRYRAPGERAGGTITKSRQIVVHAGDLVRIPATVPHAFIVSGTVPLTYLVVKQRRQQLPIRWFGDP